MLLPFTIGILIKINNLFIDENHTSQLFILVKVSMETRNESRDCVNITQTGTHFE
jgi:hypothetical protein